MTTATTDGVDVHSIVGGLILAVTAVDSAKSVVCGYATMERETIVF